MLDIPSQPPVPTVGDTSRRPAVPPRSGVRVALASLALAALASAPLGAATLEVSFAGLSHDRGRALFALFDRADGFPDRSESAMARLGADIVDGRARVVFADVAPGDYALSALHDANGSGAIELNLLGVPKERFGVSNVAKGRPTWRKARFSVGADDDAVVIEVRPLRFF